MPQTARVEYNPRILPFGDAIYRLMTASEQALETEHESRVFPVDVEHMGIRLVLPFIAVASFIGLYAVISQILATINPEGSLNCVGLLMAVFGALGAAALADRLLKRMWPSGRTLTASRQSLHLIDKRKGRNREMRLNWGERINVLAWRFTVKRGSARVQKGWIMLGCQLTQDDEQITVYTFVPAKEADEGHYADFTQLALREVLEKGQLPLREANYQRRLLKAESDRWQDGAELRREDFAQVVEMITRYVPDWRQN